MKYVNQLCKEGKMTVRKNEDKAKRERLMLKDTSLHQAYVCLHCEKRNVSDQKNVLQRRKRNVSEGTKQLPWSDAEIVRHYREAMNPAEMIMILAELNGTTAHRIREVLIGAGVTPAQSQPTKRQTAHMKMVLADRNGQYAFSDVARMHGLSVDALRHRAENQKRLVLDGREYQVKSYHRRG